jgi:quinohemoprotein ethanol dehydrogenase
MNRPGQHLRLTGAPTSLLLAALTLSVATTPQVFAADKPAAVDGARIGAADQEPGNWMSHGRTYDEQRFSPLKKINDGNVSGLGLAWTYKLDIDRGWKRRRLWSTG